MLRGGPLTFTNDRESSAVDDQMSGCARGESAKLDVEVLASPRERRVIGRAQINAHHHEQRTQETLGLAQRQVEDKTESQRGLDGAVRVLQLPSTPSNTRGLPCGDRLR